MIKLLQRYLSANRTVLVFFFFCSVSSPPVSALPAEGFGISYPNDFPAEVAADLEMLLEKASGQNWELTTQQPVQRGINLIIVVNGSYKTGESCLVTGAGKDLIQFQAPTVNGLIFGVYRHLRDLGFKFYLPDELYTIIPAGISVFSKTGKTVTPFLRIRDFFGTGGFGSGKTDTDRSVQKTWQLWKWRNGFGTEFSLAGHAGETFNLNNAAVLEKNPSWTVTPVKQNGKVNISAKLNYFNPAAVDYFTDWVLKKYTDKNYKPGSVYIRDMVSAEPADGGDFMPGSATVNGTKLNTVSDQVFYAANVAAQKLDKLFPNHPHIGVNLYAYSQHADVPSFPLHPRVFVQIIPYQFQNIAFGPAFIKRWSAKAKRFGLYDYYKYPDSYWDLPSGYSLDDLMMKALHAARAGSEGTTYESSLSKFATAIPLWVLARYMADADVKWEQQYNLLIKDLYGTASAPVQKIFKIFYRQTRFGPPQLKTAFEYLQQAEQGTKDAAIKQRLEELKLYMAYIRLYQESQNLKTGNMEQRMLPVFKIAWTLYEKKIVHSYRIMQLVSYAFLNTSGPDAATTQRYKEIHLLSFPETDSPEAYWKNKDSGIFSSAELSKILLRIQQDATINQELIQDEQSIAAVINESKKNMKTMNQVQFQGSDLTRGFFGIYAEKPVTITVDWNLINTGGKPPSITISGTNKNYTTVFDKQISGTSGVTGISVVPGESYFFIHAGNSTTYTLRLTLNGSYIYFTPSPRTTMAFIDNSKKFTYQPAYYPCYFYIPPGTAEVKYKVQLNALVITSPDGAPVTSTLLELQPGGFEIRSFKVNTKDQGKFWKAVVSGNFNYELLNIPDQWYMLQLK